ncbi:MAG: relaxase/mobilization nuclease domain-containing protein [Oscillospiraceae bacterium]
MATTKIWSVHGRIGDVIGYAENPDKTANPQFAPPDLQALRDVMNYATNDFKTERQFYVTGLNCVPEIARDQMTLTKRRFGKENGIVAFHAYQSFAPGEVTADSAHALGVELAKKLWGDHFEVIVATHLNTHCYHNHFVLNSVSFVDGKKFNDCKAFYRTMRETSDGLCREQSLSVIQNPQTNRASYATRQAEGRGEPTLYNLIRADVDAAITRCFLVQHLPEELRRMGYAVKTNAKYMAVRPEGRPRFVRLKTLGEAYTADAIERRIFRQRELGYQRAYRPLLPESKHYPLKGSLRHIRKATGFRALYLHYCYLLGAFPKHPPPKLSFVLRQELVKFDQIMAQRKLLTRYRIDTAEQLSYFIAAKEQQLEELTGARTAIVNRLRRCSDEPTTITLKERRSALTAEIGLCRQELKLTAPIPQRVAEIQRNLLLQQQQETRRTQPAKSKKKEMIR